MKPLKEPKIFSLAGNSLLKPLISEALNSQALGALFNTNFTSNFPISATLFCHFRFLDPLIFGQYPKSMRERVGGGRLPNFTRFEASLVKGSLDFVGINHYTTYYGKNNSVLRILNDTFKDSGALTSRTSAVELFFGRFVQRFFVCGKFVLL